MRRLTQHPGTRLDLLDHFLFIGEDNLAAADRFVAAAEAAFFDLVEWPDSGHVLESNEPELDGIRIGHIRGFRNYLIVYRPSDDRIEILGVFHGARDLAAAIKARLAGE